MKTSIGFFNSREVRVVWDDVTGKWWFSVLDVEGILNGQPDYANAILEDLIDLMTTDESFLESIVRSTRNTPMVRRRFDKWRTRLHAILPINEKA